MNNHDRRSFLRGVGGAAAGAALLPGLSLASFTDPRPFTILPAGAIKPGGWIREQLRTDLTTGVTGRYDLINPTVAQDLFGPIKRQSNPSAFVSGKKPWWSGEHEGYWKDSVTRMAFLTGNDEFQERARGWMERILEYQSPDGYIGIYTPDNRFRHRRENGELWTQSRIMNAMLAYSEFTGDAEVLRAVERAVALTMDHYGPGRSYFASDRWPVHGSGVSHGLAFMDILEWLARKTGKTEYVDFARFLYADFDRCRTNNDMARRKLSFKALPFTKHGAHICEHFMIPFFLASATGRERYRRLAANAWFKLQRHLTPSGALVSHENVYGEPGAADSLYEYCCTTELVISLVRAAQFTGEVIFADLAERLTMNAGQGARLPDLTALAYLTADNRFAIDEKASGGREGYSATHEAAACCTLNAGRLMPYYVEGMWMRSPDGVATLLYGPSEVNLEINGAPVRIMERTAYPFSDRVVFEVEPSGETTFELSLRVPGFSRGIEVIDAGGARQSESGGFLRLSKTWRPGDRVEIRFNFPVRHSPARLTKSGLPQGLTIERGPLLFGVKIPAQLTAIAEPGGIGLYNYHVGSLDETLQELRLHPRAEFTAQVAAADEELHPWADPPLVLAGELQSPGRGARAVTLQPMGSTVLRKCVFEGED